MIKKSRKGIIKRNTFCQKLKAKILKLVKNKRFLKLLVISILFFLFSMLLTNFAARYISKHFEKPPIVGDLLWHILPYIPMLWLSEVLIFIGLFLMITWSLKKNKEYIPYLITLYSIFYILRAGIMIFTPLGFPDGNGFLPSDGSITRFGSFPSGHLSSPILTFLVSKKKIFLIIALGISFILMISRGHYSIDLVGTILLAYFIFSLSNKYLKKYFFKSLKVKK